MDLKKVRTKLTKAQAYVTKYLMKEEEYVHERAKVKEEVESMWKSHGKYMAEVNSLHHRCKHVKKEQKQEAVAFEHRLRKLWQELKDGEKTWS